MQSEGFALSEALTSVRYKLAEFSRHPIPIRVTTM